uniref:myosin light chain kinase family member 4 n=1 Tax=Jaculus jaculus TaxID=51337 RepID=UPI001E1B5930|nr:myosin light chain kinase family member 4 [Jaculus jaculus]
MPVTPALVLRAEEALLFRNVQKAEQKQGCQENGALTSHDCVVIYKSETHRVEHHSADSSFMGLTTKMLKAKRLEGISSCCSSSSPLENMALFQCMEDVEKVKCFLEENSSVLSSKSGDNEVEKVWSSPALKEKTPAKGGRASTFTERSSQDQFSEKEKVNKLNQKNVEKTNSYVVQRSLTICHTERQDKEDNFGPKNSTEARDNAGGKESPSTESLERQEDHSRGEVQDSVGNAGCPLFYGEESGLPFKEGTRVRETEEEGESTGETQTTLDQSSRENQHVDETSGSPSPERCISSLNSISTPGVLTNSATESSFQNTDHIECASSSKRRVTEECFLTEDKKKSRIDGVGTEGMEQAQRSLEDKPQESAGVVTSREQDQEASQDEAPTPAAPFDHRIVTARQSAVDRLYTVSKTDILGGGRFGQVHKCEEKATGLKLAAKIIKTRGTKNKEDVKNEISIMNQLDHVNIIQLYDAFESTHDIILVMEYVEGGELFDRIIDENCNLTELDTILFIKQICEGIRHMHQMSILHLDLKPENILCVNRNAKQIKIIDFGLARRYKPREKLKVNFGTPEFLAPEVVNYDFVSFSTDMWSVGVITYMLLSGLSPFLGDSDAETLSNVLACRWDLEEEEFQDVSEEAREFISKLLIKEKSWRISASQALGHPWLSDHKLHARLSTQEKKCSSDTPNLVTK